jgi:hypothetical protein
LLGISKGYASLFLRIVFNLDRTALTGFLSALDFRGQCSSMKASLPR